MNSSPGDEAPLAASAGQPAPPERVEDGIARLLEIMEVVEMLIPEWPPRTQPIIGRFLL
jgi:hypothetical protein